MKPVFKVHYIILWDTPWIYMQIVLEVGPSQLHNCYTRGCHINQSIPTSTTPQHRLQECAIACIRASFASTAWAQVRGSGTNVPIFHQSPTSGQPRPLWPSVCHTVNIMCEQPASVHRANQRAYILHRRNPCRS